MIRAGHSQAKKAQPEFMKISGLLVFAFVLLLGAASLPASASGLYTDTCDQDYYDTLKERAWLLANRKMRQAQNYIFKPDSVLDYSCFPLLNNVAALHTEQIFSEAHAGHCFPDSLDCSLELIVMTPVTSYLNNNFNHNFLGGHSSLSRDPYDPNQVLPDPSAPDICKVMTNVWMEAKCANFMPKANLDGFYSFLEYASLEPRDLPTACTTNVASEWNNAVDNTYNAPAWVSDINNASVDFNNTYKDYFEPVPSGTGCGPFIRTGVVIQDDSSWLWNTPINDGICTNPGCTQTDSDSCVAIF